MPMVEGKGVTKHFGGVVAVSNLDFVVEQGELLGLIGPNGAGKTTLFNLMSATIKPTAGIITFKEAIINHLKPYQVCRRGVARTFQIVKTFPNMSVLENVFLGSLYGKSGIRSSKEALDAAAALLEFVGLYQAKKTAARELSLANQKRLEVARALATNPELLLLDEIMVGLNQTEVVQAMELIRKIWDKRITIVMIEHVMKAIMTLCERILVLHHGQKIAEGTPHEIAASETVMRVYLGEKTRARR